MTNRIWRFLIAVTLALVMGLLPLLGTPAAAQSGRTKTASRILYHDGDVMPDASNVYFIFYGCWETSVCGVENDWATHVLLVDLITGLGGTPYMNINTLYPDMYGSAPNGGLVFGGSVVDRYSHSATLTDADVQDVIWNLISSGQLPQDSPHGLYIVLTSSDVHFDGFCTNVAQYHGRFVQLGITHNYAVVGNPRRCPVSAAPQFVLPNGSLLPTPNGNFAADAMVSSIAHVLNEAFTNPGGAGWFDRYGLENSDKCQGTFGQTYTTPNGAQANMRIGSRDFLIQQNWVNSATGKGYCGLSYR